MADTVRLDKYLWAVRIYKTRTDATEDCKGNKVRVGGSPAKPSRMIKVGEVIEVRRGPIQYIYKVKALLEKRVGASLVPNYLENLTPEEELAKLHSPTETFFIKRDRGTGRPTKKDRREMEALMGEVDYEYSGVDFIPGEDDDEDEEDDDL